jgi:putative transposase
MKLTGINQLWVADMTYIRLHREFVYLAVILDAWSRKVVGWEAGEHAGGLSCQLRRSTRPSRSASRRPAWCITPTAACSMPAMITWRSWTQHKMIPSMSRPANPYDNASCESFMKTLKREEIYANEYQDIDDLRANIEQFIDCYYNRQRLHSALGYRPPEEFEQLTPPAMIPDGATMSFFRHGEIYRWDERQGNGVPDRPSTPPHPIDESPVGYSLAGWSPPEPASASPTEGYTEGEQAV